VGLITYGNDLIEIFSSIPDMMIVNLETSLTTSNDYARWKGIHYKAHPLNVQSLKVLGEDSVVTLANNHVLDWGENGLKETIDTLKRVDMKYTGAGYTLEEAMKPSLSRIKNVNVAVVAIGLPSAGVPEQWMAGTNKCGVYVQEEASLPIAKGVMEDFQKYIHDNDEGTIKIVSVHMGPNWNWGISDGWRDFTHALIDHGADFVVVHSSHHVKGIEVYKNKMISYGLGDFLNDYEGITSQGYEAYRQDLTCLYLPKIQLNGELRSIDIIPCQIKNLKVQRATNQDDIEWLRSTLTREGKTVGTSCEKVQDVAGNTNLRIIWKT
jgi:poly-gamma-glutamate capsule biosynthesis protein CapA/YwtB (metallophosphatase superfamily)